MTQPLSVQLYTVRDALSADLPGTLRRIASIGYTNVEAFGYVEHAEELRDALADAGLQAPSGHARLLGQCRDRGKSECHGGDAEKPARHARLPSTAPRRFRSRAIAAPPAGPRSPRSPRHPRDPRHPRRCGGVRTRHCSAARVPA